MTEVSVMSPQIRDSVLPVIQYNFGTLQEVVCLFFFSEVYPPLSVLEKKKRGRA
jgi:hypothetical protein